MGSVGAPVIRRIVEVSGTDCPAELLAELGLSASNDPLDAGTPAIDANAYYDLLERVTRSDDHGLPFRYADALQAEDLGVLGLAMKTAPTVNDALRRLIRYVLVLSDTLEYELVPQ
ncbi:MAG: AraC family transcriptional regulator ligand-binding domain-containing protein, partial [Acidimicrobiales bacterium]